jgi:hypothetical protein
MRKMAANKSPQPEVPEFIQVSPQLKQIGAFGEIG